MPAKKRCTAIFVLCGMLAPALLSYELYASTGIFQPSKIDARDKDAWQSTNKRVRQVYKSRSFLSAMKKERAAAGASPSRPLLQVPPAQMRDNSAGTAGVTLGILALLLSLLSPIPGVVLGIIALVFGMVQRQSRPSRWSAASIILGCGAIVLGLLGIILAVAFPELLGGISP